MGAGELNRIFSERTRLMIMAALASSRGEIDFTTLTETLHLTRGNLSVHMRKLEEAGYVSVEKGFVDRKPRTTYRCTALGRTETKKYLRVVEEQGAVSPQSYRAALEALNAKVGVNVFDVEKLVAK